MLPRPVTWILVVLASIVLPLAMVSTWVAALASDTDHYVETVAPLAEDDDVIDAAHDRLEDTLLDALGAPANERPQITDAIDKALTRVLTGPEFPPAWRMANRTLHTETLRVLQDRAPARTDASGQRWVQLDLAPIADDVLAAVENQLGTSQQIDLSSRDLRIDLVPASKVAAAQDYYNLLQTLGFWLPITWLAVVVTALATARRKVVTVGRLAIGAVISLAVLTAALLVARSLITHAVSNSADKVLVRALWDAITGSLWAGVASGLAIAVAVVGARVVIALVRRSRAAASPDSAQR